MTREACSFHSDEDPQGVFVSDEVGYSFTCEREGHPEPGPRTWFRPPEPPPGLELGGLADELGLAVELPRALSEYRGKWVEYGVLEHAYAQ